MSEDQAHYGILDGPLGPDGHDCLIEPWPEGLQWESWPKGSNTTKRARVPGGYLVGQVIIFEKKRPAFAMAFVPDQKK